MAFERMATDQVKYDVAVENQEKIEPWFSNGTMWCDYIGEEVAQTILESLQTFTGYKVVKSLLKATETEPWDQWAFDITGDKA
jgi:hypothetical protein